MRSPLRNGRLAIRRRASGLALRLARRWGGLPHTEGTVDSPPPPVAADVTALWKRTLSTREPLVDRAHAETVTMTTHGGRLRDVWLAVESVGRGTRRPGRIVLWLDSTARLPWRLRRQRRRGLEVRRVPAGWGVHTKYWPYLLEGRLSGPLVTADDDILYPPHWLDDLMRAHEHHPDDIIAHRAHHIAMNSPETFAPYATWQKCLSVQPSYAHFATSVSGQLLPSAFQVALRAEGDGFLALAPSADDVWLHRCAVKHGFRTRQIAETPLHWWFIPGSQTTGLNAVNVVGGANDRQMDAAHDDATKERVWGDAVRLS